MTERPLTTGTPDDIVISGAVAHFEPIGLPELERVALMNRYDTKYLVSIEQMRSILAAVSGDYRVLDVDGVRLNRYRTCYFDTDGFAFYLDHHAGKPTRYKVRSRAYLESGQAFLEVKKKRGGRTEKERMRVAQLDFGLPDGADAFLASRIPVSGALLAPKLVNSFSRITLAGSARPERVTIDIDLEFEADGRSLALPGLAIAEVKQAGIDRGSPLVRQMRAACLRSTAFSKYCIGAALVYHQLKHNRFKPVLDRIGSLTGDFHV
ncbi:MAG: polyphosphate polymerase domain-containing protein [Dehalococcoidia bacterium]